MKEFLTAESRSCSGVISASVASCDEALRKDLLVSDDISTVPTVHFVRHIPAACAEGGVRGNEPGRSKARRPVTFECGSPLLHVAILADASQKASSAGLETWIRERNNGWLTIARRAAR